MKPFSEIIGRGNFFKPQIDTCFFFSDTPGPEPVNQYPVSFNLFFRLIYSLQPDFAFHNFLHSLMVWLTLFQGEMSPNKSTITDFK